MICRNCGTMSPDGVKFCCACGSRLEELPAPIPDMPPVDTGNGELSWGNAETLDQNAAAAFVPGWEDNSGSEPTTVLNENSNLPRCPRCGNVSYGGNFCTNCGWSASVSRPVTPYDRQQPVFTGRPDVGAPVYHSTPKRGSAGKMIGLIAGIAVAALVAVVLLVGVATNWFGLTGPAATIASAVQKTLSEDSFTVDFSMDIDYDTIEGTAYVNIDADRRELMMLLEMEYDGEYGEIAIYDGYAIIHSEGYWAYNDISDQLDEYFDGYEQTGESELDWEEILDEFSTGMYRELSEYVDFDELNNCIRDYVKKLNSKRWLKKNAGYSTKRENGATVHCFAPDLYQFTVASVSMLEPAVIHGDDYETMMENLAYDKDIFDEISLELSIAIKSGKMVGLGLMIEADYEQIRMEYEFSDIGKTKLDEEELEDMLEKAIRNS